MALLIKNSGYLLLKMGGKILLKGDAGALLHRIAPAWRTVDAGNGQAASITFGSALDPQELKYYTIDWTTELDGTSDTIALSEFTLSPSATVAGLLIHAVTTDTKRITVWFKLDASVQNSTVWLGAGEVHTMLTRITTVSGQIFDRTIRLPVRQL